MSVNESGMNIVIEVGSVFLSRLMENVLTAQLPLLRPEGDTRFDLHPTSPGFTGVYWAERPTDHGGIPDFMLYSTVEVEGERADGTRFHFPDAGVNEELVLYFQAVPAVSDNGILVTLYYRGAGGNPDGGGMSVDLGPDIDRLRDELERCTPFSMHFDIAVWDRFPTLQPRHAYFAIPSLDNGSGTENLAIGVEVEGGTEVNQSSFRAHPLQSLLDDAANMAIAIEGELILRLVRNLFDQEVLQRLSSLGVLEGYIEDVEYWWCNWTVEEGYAERCYGIRYRGIMRLTSGVNAGDWDVTEIVSTIVDLSARILFDGGWSIEGLPDPDDFGHSDQRRDFTVETPINGANLSLSPVASAVRSMEYCLPTPAGGWGGDAADPSHGSVTIYEASFADYGGTPGINVIADDRFPFPLSIELAIHHTAPGCKVFAEHQGSTEAWFTIQNTGGGPLRLRVTASPADLFVASAQSEILLAGEETGVRVVLRSVVTGEHSGTVLIIHNAADEGDILINVTATVTYTYENVNVPVSDEFRNVICSWADGVMFARGFPWWRNYFDELPIDPPFTEVFDLGLRDPGDDCRFVARTEAGELLAEISSHTHIKWLHLPVDRGATLRIEMQPRGRPNSIAQRSFFFKMRKKTVQMLCSFAVEGSSNAAAFDGGLCVSSKAGLMAVDTLDPWRPQVTACLEEVGSLAGVATYGNRAFTVGEKGLFLVDISEFGKPKVLYRIDDLAGACAVRCFGNYLWVVSGDTLTVLEVSKEHKLNSLAKSQFKANALDLAVYGRRGAVLHTSGLFIFELQGTRLTLAGQHSVKPSGSVSLFTHGSFVCLADAEMGTQILDISQTMSPHTVAHYVQPFWSAGFVRDYSRSIAYKMLSKGNGFDIFLVHANRVIK